jgi:hypothetical protein
VLGIQTAGRTSPAQPGLAVLAVSGEARLADLVRLEELGTTDISTIAEAAREGVRCWQRC